MRTEAVVKTKVSTSIAEAARAAETICLITELCASLGMKTHRLTELRDLLRRKLISPDEREINRACEKLREEVSTEILNTPEVHSKLNRLLERRES